MTTRAEPVADAAAPLEGPAVSSPRGAEAPCPDAAAALDDLRPVTGRAIAAALGPRPIVVVGTLRDGRANFAPAAFCTPLSYDPPLAALGLKPSAWSCRTIEETGRCTLSTVGAEAAEAVLWYGSRSGRAVDKSTGFPCAWTDAQAATDEAAASGTAGAPRTAGTSGTPAAASASGPSAGPLPYPVDALTVLEAELVSAADAGDHRLLVLRITGAVTRLPATNEGRLATEPTLLCLEHSAFAQARPLAPREPGR